MGSSINEILEVLEPWLRAGELGIAVGETSYEQTKCTVVYNKIVDYREAFSIREINQCIVSYNEKSALQNGCNTEQEVNEYLGSIIEEAKQRAKETNEPQICDQIGLLNCQDPKEE